MLRHARLRRVIAPLLVVFVAPVAAAAGRQSAEVDLRQRIEKSPSQPGPYLELARLLAEGRRPVEALDILSDAMAAIRADRPAAPVEPAEPTAREGELRARLAADPGSIGLHLDLAGLLVAARRHDDALAMVSRAMSLLRSEAGPAPASGTAGSLESPLRVGGDLREPRKTADARPAYPAAALQAGVQGMVILEVIIDFDGRVYQAKVIRSVPLLDQAALDAVRQWEFTPTFMNGRPSAVIMTVTVSFTLQ